MSIWIPCYATLWDHPKLLRLSRRLVITREEAQARLLNLWHWAFQNAPDGNLNRFESVSIAEGSRYHGDPKKFVQALRFCGWLDADGRLHDWDDHVGKFLTSKKKHIERQRRYREKNDAHSDVTETSQETSPLPPQRRHGERRTVPYRTVPDLTPTEVGGKGVVVGEANGAPAGFAEWPTSEEWKAAASMEGLTAVQIEAEWSNQERKNPAERWRNIDRTRLRHHAAFVRSKIAERSPGPAAKKAPFEHESPVPHRPLKKLN